MERGDSGLIKDSTSASLVDERGEGTCPAWFARCPREGKERLELGVVAMVENLKSLKTDLSKTTPVLRRTYTRPNHHHLLGLLPVAPLYLTTPWAFAVEPRFGLRRQHQSTQNRCRWLRSDLAPQAE